MEAIISNFRKGRKTQTTNQFVLVVKGYSNKEKAAELVGKEVTWKSTAGKEIKGKITFPHGNNGAVRALFERGLPGQALGGKVNIN
ncbi:MAG TPA: 50S ribosomal protein L35ae [Candidatus Nanoarchaeia archaeon]|nr:50S ribosomal protein L35ae [Candidatus Nanoarchaeia archaeon]